MKIAGFLRSRLAVYAAINALAAGATFLAVPVLVRLLGLDGFGTWSLVEPLVFLGTTLALLGAEHGTMKDVAYAQEDVRIVLGELLTTGSGAVLVTGGLVFLAAGWLVEAETAALVAGLAMAEGLLMLVTSAARAARRDWAFAVSQVGRSLGFLVLLLAFVWGSGSPTGHSIADVLVLRLGLVVALTLVAGLLLLPRLRFNLARYADALRYGGFILITSLLTLGLDMTDRYVVGLFYDTATVGAYMVHVKLASVVGQGVVMPFSLWFAAERLRRMQDRDGGSAFFDRTALGLTAACCAASGSAFLVSPSLVALLAPGAAFDALSLAALLTASSLIGLTYALNIGLLKPGKTHLNVYPVAVGLLVTLAAGPVLARAMGPDGAAIGRLLGTLVFLVVLARLSQRIHPVAFRHARMIGLAAATAIASAAVAAAVPGDTTGGACVRLFLFLCLVALAAGVAALRSFPAGIPTWSSQR